MEDQVTGKRARTGKLRILSGLFVVLGNGWWLWRHADRWYQQHFTDILFIVMLPDWLLVFEMVIGLAGIFIGLGMIRNRIPLLKGVILATAILGLGFTVEYGVI